MRDHSSQLMDVLSGSFNRRLFVNVFNGSERVREDLAFESWTLNGALGAEIAMSGSGVVVAPSIEGESLVPVGTAGILSPFRCRLELVFEVYTDDGFSERVTLGVFRVTDVPSAVATTAVVNGAERAVASRVAVSLASLDENVSRDGFTLPESTPKGSSVWGEIRRISGMPVEESVPDVVTTVEKAWEPGRGSRLKALHELGRLLGGDIVPNSRGALVAIPDVMGAPVGTLRLGRDGTVTEIGHAIETDTVYNIVFGSFEDAAGVPFTCVAKVETGDLAVDGDYGPNMRDYASDLVKTRPQGQAAVDAVLAQSIGSQMYDVKVQCHVNPLVEIGDVWAVEGWTRPLVGRVTDAEFSDSELMTLTLRVKRALT